MLSNLLISHGGLIKTKNEKPNVFNYLDVNLFLKDYYQYRKNLKDSFSFDKWAIEIGLDTTSLLRLILTKKRKITESLVDLFAKQLFEAAPETEYFCHLINYSQTNSKEEKKAAGKRLTEILRRQVVAEELPAKNSFLNSTLTPRLYSVLDNDQIDRSSLGLANFFNVTEKQITFSLKALIDLKLVQLFDGQYFSNSGAFKINEVLQNKDLINYHKELLKEAELALDKPPNLRKTRAGIALLDEAAFKEFWSKVDDLFKYYLSLGLDPEVSNKRLYQLNLNIHAVSEKIQPLGQLA